MKTKTEQKDSFNSFNCLPRLVGAIVLAALSAASSAFAASQTWTNAPADNSWANVNNWIGGAVPGAANSTTTSDTATFNSAIPGSGIGGAGNAITNDAQRGVRNLLFDTANCGAYVFGNSLNTNWLEVINSGNITINSTVANPIVFNEAVNFRGPSSVNYTYFFTNNAASANATLYIPTITNNANSTTRPWSITLAGSNTGTNTIGHIDDRTSGTAEGAILIDVYGPGRWVFSGPNDLPQKTSASTVAHVYVDSGTLEVKDPGSLGSITVANLYVWSGGTLQIDGVTLNNNGISIYGGGTIRMNGSGTVNGITVTTAAGTSATLATTSSSDVMTVGNAANQPTGGAADSVLHVAGPGTVVLSQSANYAGKWSLDAGTTQLGSGASLGSGANLNIAAGATFDISPQGATTYTLGTSALSASGTGTTLGSTAAAVKADPSGTLDLATGSKPISLTFRPTLFSGDSTHPALYISQGTLSIGGNTFMVNNVSGTALGPGTYVLIQQASGSITSGGSYAVIVTGSGMVAGATGSINVSGGNVNLVVSPYASKNLTWQGGNPDNTWDANNTANWLNGATLVAFTNSDNVTFNSTGAAYPTVSLVGTLAPGSVTVDTTAANYTFSGSGWIVGGTGLTKKGTGTLQVQTVNTYLGATVITNGTLQLGAINALPAASDVTLNSPGILDMNAISDALGALTGNGTVDTLAGGSPVLSVGNNNDSGSFSGIIQNTYGTVGLTKSGNGVQTLAGANAYTGPTEVDAGTLTLANPSALGPGASAVTVNGGTLDLNGYNTVIASLAGGTLGVLTNSGATVATNTLTITNTGAATTYNGVITENSGGAKVQVVLLGTAELRLNGNNTYSAGTLVGGSATIGVGPGGAIGTGSIVLSNGTTFYMHNNGSTSVFPGNNVTLADNSIAAFNSGQLGNGYAGLVSGSATATNSIVGPVSCSATGTKQYQSFLGTVVVQSAGEIRWGAGTAITNGGDNTTFEIDGTMITRGAGTVSLGALTGGGAINGPAGAAGYGNYLIGAKGVDCVFPGTFTGSNNLVKVGARTLTFNGVSITTNTDDATYTNYLYTPLVSYLGPTTVSNGVLALVVPNNLSNSPSIDLASATAVLDASQMGYTMDQIDPDTQTVTNQLLVTNGVFELYSGQTLSGLGTILGTLQADSGSTVSPGNSIGTLTATRSITLAGTTLMELNRTNSPNSDELVGASIAYGGTLTVTNVGPTLLGGETFQLFSGALSGSFAATNLPALAPGLSWDTSKLNVNGELSVLGPPQIGGLQVAGTTNVLSGTGGMAGAAYNVLTSTNVALPLASWPVLGNGTFASDGSWSYTNRFATNALQFYTVQEVLP